MSLLIAFLTFILVVNCLFLILLVLVQLPKKEAGAGLAFGAGAVDTLIGAGSGNALTKITKYATASFLGMAVLLAVVNSQRSHSSTRSLDRELSRKASAAPVLGLPSAASAPNSGALSNNPGQAAAAATTGAVSAASQVTNVLQAVPAAAAPSSGPLTLPNTAPAQPQQPPK